MKQWRREAMKEGKKDGRRPGRGIKAGAQMQAYIFKGMPKTYPLLAALFKNAGIVAVAAPQPITLDQEVKNEAV